MCRGKKIVQRCWWSLIVAALIVQCAWAEAIVPPGFVRLRDVAPSIHQDIRYAGRFNFTGEIVPGYDRPDCILQHRAADALSRAESRLLKEGFGLKVYDCYRPSRAVRAFAAWSISSGANRMKSIFYAGYNKAELFARGFISSRSRHAMGIAVDVGLIRAGESYVDPPTTAGRCDGPFEQRANESSLDFGTTFDCFSDLSATANPDISVAARSNRERLRRALEAEGFRNYAREWWHYEFSTVPTHAYDFPIR
jgi:zinc D-Ala-D-Ala dipeptidase